MLNREICKHCIDEQSDEKSVCWDEVDDKNWENNDVFCPVKLKKEEEGKEHWRPASSAGVPPDWCPYDTEHAVSEKC